MRRFFILLPLVLFPVLVLGDVRINEFSPDETPQQIELYNNATVEADLSGWRLDDDGGSSYYSIPPGTVIYPKSCLVFSAGFNLNKSSPDMARLLRVPENGSTEAVLADSYAYGRSPGNGFSFSRIPDGEDSWVATAASWGKLNGTGEGCVALPTATVAPAPSPTPQSPTEMPPIVSPPPQDYGNIFISEIMAYPETGESEWVELYNGNDMDADLTGWFVDDAKDSGAAPKRIAMTVAARSYASIDMTASVFNNGGDEVRLLGPDKTPKDAVEYGTVAKNKTLSRVSWDNDTFCETEPSKNAPNYPCRSSSLSSSRSSSNQSLNPTARFIPQKLSTRPRPDKPTPAVFFAPMPQQGQVLGTESGSGRAQRQPPTRIRHFTFLSSSYSILTILSLLIKIRNAS